MRPPKILFVLDFLLALTVWGRDVEIRETVLDIASPSELSGTRFVPDAGTLCATQIRGVVRLGGAYRPGAKPFRGVASVVIDMPSLPSAVTQGVVQLNLHHRDSGARKSFRAPWMGRTVVKTDLDPKAWYQTDDIYFNPERRAEPIPKVSVVGVTGLRMGTPAEAFSLDVETGSALHVTDDPAYVCVLLRNRSVCTLSVTGTVTATHYFRTRVHTPFAGTVAAAGALRLPLGDLLRGVPASRGLWRVTAEVFSEGSRAVPDETRFAVLNAHAVTSRLPPERFRLGVNVHYPKTDSSEYPRYLEALQTVGCKLTRGGPFAFNRCWPKAEMPEPDFSEPDRLMADLKRLGISVNAGCWPNPDWSSPVAEEGYRKVIHTRPIRGLMGRYCEKLARHFGTDIDYIETANEPDWWNADEFPAADYVDYQKECYAGVKCGSPAIRVIPGGFTTADSSHPKIRKKGFQETVLREAKGFYDVHPVHLHGAFAGYENAILSQFLPMRAREGVSVPWFPNETGHTLVQGDEDRAAVSVWQKILFSQAHGACDYVWYNLRASDWPPKNAEGGYGMMTRDWYPRATYAAFSALAHAVSGFEADGIVCEAKGRHLYRFRRNRDVVFAGWDAWGERPSPIRIRSDAADARTIDMMGNGQTVARQDGCFTFPVSTHPAALCLTGGSYAEPVEADVRNVPTPKLKARALVSEIEGREPDFTLDRITQVVQLYEAIPEMERRTWKGPRDLSAKIWVGRTADDLRIRFEVEDDIHVQRVSARELYLNDGIQFILEAPGQGGNFEFGLAMRSDGTPLKALWIVPTSFSVAKVLSAVHLETVRRGTVTTYDFSVPLKAIGFDTELLANGFRFNAIVYDDDGMGTDRDGWIEIRPGIAGAKRYDDCPCFR